MSPYITLIVRKPFSTNCWVKPPYMVQEIMKARNYERVQNNQAYSKRDDISCTPSHDKFPSCTHSKLNVLLHQLVYLLATEMASASSLDACSWTCRTCHSLAVLSCQAEGSSFKALQHCSQRSVLISHAADFGFGMRSHITDGIVMTPGTYGSSGSSPAGPRGYPWTTLPVLSPV